MKSIRSKILICMALTVSVSLTVIGAMSSYLNYSSTMETLEQSMREMAEVAAERVEQELIAQINVAYDTGSIARLADMERPAADKKTIIDQRAETHGFERGNILGPDGVSILDGKDFSDREYYRRAMAGESYVSEPVVSKTTGKLSIIVAAPLWEGGIPDSRVVGVVFFVPKETFLNDIVTAINISEHGAAYIINAEGYTIADTTMDTVMSQNIEEEAGTDNALAQLAAIHGQMRAGEAGFGRYEINGARKFSAFSPIGGTDGWSIGITAPVSDFTASTVFGVVLTLILLAVSIAVAVIISLLLANRIGRPIRQCAQRLELLAGGDLHTPAPQVNARDETGILARATGDIAATVSGVIGDIEYGLAEIAGGNFQADSRVKELYVGDYRQIAASMYELMNQLSETLAQVRVASEQVSAGSGQVAAGAQALSQGAAQQASSVEELAAAVGEISGQVRDTAQNAAAARDQTDKAGREVGSCNQQMQEMIGAIAEISRQSGEIGKIIKTIEDIAFQTNILALNAAVEAARAGAAGKGFAVVADEVRSLANKSQEASRTTSALIEGTIRAVERGTQIARETAGSLEKVVSDTGAVSVTVDKIAGAAEEQADSITQVTQGIDQISSVVQTNSATAEESAAASEELSSQAELLRELVARFRLAQKGEQGAAGPGAPEQEPGQ